MARTRRAFRTDTETAHLRTDRRTCCGSNFLPPRRLWRVTELGLQVQLGPGQRIHNLRIHTAGIYG